MVIDLELLEPMVLVTMRPTRRPSRQVQLFNDPAVRIMFQVTYIVRFLLERGLRFRNLGFCHADIMMPAAAI
jgi:hypothetical protein